MKIISSLFLLCCSISLSFAGYQQQNCTLPVITNQPINVSTCAASGGEQISLSVQALDAVSYQWKKGNTPIQNETYNTLIFNTTSIADAGDYTVDISNACGTVTSDIATITVYPEASAGSLSFSEQLCPGQIPSPIVNSALSTGDNGSQSYIWQKKADSSLSSWTIIQDQTGSSYTPVDPITTNTIYRRLTTAYPGCFSNTILKKVYPSAIFINDPGIICSGTEFTFAGSLQDAEITIESEFPNVIYNWYLNDVLASQNRLYQTDSLKNGDKIKLAINPSYVCSPDPIVSNIITAQISNSIVPSVTITGNYNVDLCSPVALTTNPTNEGLQPSYRWMKNDIAIDWNDLDILIENDFINGDIFTCEMTSSLSCATVSKVISNPITANISPYPTPLISMSTSGMLTEGQSITLKVIPSEDSPYFFAYTWYVNGQIIGGQSDLLTATFKSGDVYTVKMDVSYSCSKTYYSISEPLTLSSDFSASITGPVVVSLNQKNVTYSVQNRTGMSYFWTVPADATIVSGQGTNSIIVDFGVNTSSSTQRVTGGSVITVRETNAASVSSTLTLELSIVTNTKEGQLAASVLVYPIPADNECYVEFTGSFPSSPLNYTLYDAKGILITKGSISSNETPIHLETVPSGIYLLLIETDGSIASKKIIKK
jgi:hypothetical protein